MEQVVSLINKLEQQIKQGAPATEMLATTALLRSGLQAAACETFTPRESVAVWLPAGYKAPVKEPLVPEPVSAPVAEPEPEVVAVKQEPLFIPLPPRAPAPPQMVNTAPEIPQLNADNITPADGPVIFQLELEDEEADEADEPMVIPEPAREEPVAVVPKPEPVQVRDTPAPRPFPQYPDAATLMKNIFPATPAPRPAPREVNEAVAADPITALNQRLFERKTEVADVLVKGSRITDIRKAISINEKYQMINSLFRGDEDMFERSIRTLNNFGTLPEARFWMQRELILKLGWKEDDELVQHFQGLVSRRFS